MKQTIRKGVYETNSSSSHTLSFVSVQDYNNMTTFDYPYDICRSQIQKTVSFNEIDFQNLLGELRGRLNKDALKDKKVDWVKEITSEFMLDYMQIGEMSRLEEMLANQGGDIIVEPTPSYDYYVISVYTPG